MLVAVRLQLIEGGLSVSLRHVLAVGWHCDGRRRGIRHFEHSRGGPRLLAERKGASQPKSEDCKNEEPIGSAFRHIQHQKIPPAVELVAFTLTPPYYCILCNRDKTP